MTSGTSAVVTVMSQTHIGLLLLTALDIMPFPVLQFLDQIRLLFLEHFLKLAIMLKTGTMWPVCVIMSVGMGGAKRGRVGLNWQLIFCFKQTGSCD